MAMCHDINVDVMPTNAFGASLSLSNNHLLIWPFISPFYLVATFLCNYQKNLSPMDQIRFADRWFPKHLFFKCVQHRHDCSASYKIFYQIVLNLTKFTNWRCPDLQRALLYFYFEIILRNCFFNFFSARDRDNSSTEPSEFSESDSE